MDAVWFNVLINNLDRVVIDILFIDNFEIFSRTVIQPKGTNVVDLNTVGFVFNIVTGTSKIFVKKAVPFLGRKNKIIKLLDLGTKIRNEFILAINR